MTPTDRHKSVRNLCEMKDYGGGVLVLSFVLFFFLLVRAFVVGRSQIFLFLVSKYRWISMSSIMCILLYFTICDMTFDTIIKYVSINLYTYLFSQTKL